MTISTLRRLSYCVVALVIVVGLMPVRALRAQALEAPEAEKADPSETTPPAAALKTLAVVAFTNYDQLASDVNFIGSLIGQPNGSQLLEAQIAAKTGGKGLAGIDKKKPWGLIVQTDGAQFLPVVCLPVTNADQVLETVSATVGEVKDGAGGLKQITLPQGSVFIKNAGGWLFLSRNQASLARVPADPQAALTNMLAKYDVTAHAAVQNVPLMYRQMALLTLQAAMQQQGQRQQGESDADFSKRQKALQTQMQQTVQQVQELDTLTLGVSIDAPQKEGVLEFTYKVLANGALAKQFAAYKEPKTNFAGFRQNDAAASFSVVANADPEAIKKDLVQFETMIQGARTQFNKTVDDSADKLEGAKRDVIKAAAGEWFDAIEETLKSGQIDSAASLNVSPDSVGLIAGALVKDPAKVENGLKKLDEEFKGSSHFEGVKWNAGSHGDVKFHTLTVPVPASEDGPLKLLGEQAEVAVGVGPQAVYLALGKDNLNALKKAIDASKAEANKSVPPFEIRFAFGPLMEVAATQLKDPEQRQRAQAVAQMLKANAPGRDHVRIVGQMVPNGLRYRIEAEEGALQTLLIKALEAQQNAAANQGAPGQPGF